MKRYIHLVTIVSLASFASYSWTSQGDYSDNFSIVKGVIISPDDFSIVNHIKNKSDLTEADVEKWKLLWLGALTKPVKYLAYSGSMALVGYSGHQAAEGRSQLIESVFKEYVPADLSHYKPSANTQAWLTDPIVWASAGALGGGYLAYKFVYPRIYSGILDSVTKYADMCKNLAVARGTFISSTILNKVFLQWPDNAYWVTDNVMAQYFGIENLIQQAGVAGKLLDQLNAGGDDPLRERIVEYYSNLSVNKENLRNEVLLVQKARKELIDKINADIAEKDAIAMRQAQLTQMQAQAGALRAGKWAIYWGMASDMVKKTFQGAQYLYDNAGKIGLFVGIGALGVQLGNTPAGQRIADYLQSKLSSMPAARQE